MVVTLTGNNDFARKAELEKLISAFLREHDEMAVERFDGEEATAEQMRAAVQSLPFLTARKLVVLREPGKQKPWADNISDILKDIADTSDVVIIESKLDKRLSYYKTLKKSTDFRELGELDANSLAQWATKHVISRGGSLSAADARLLIDRMGANQQLIKNELDKLLAFDPNVIKTSIAQLTEPLPQSTVFELLDAALHGKTQRAIQLYREQRTLRVEPQAIIALLAWQLHVLAVTAAAGSRSSDDIARAAKLNPYVVRKTQGLARSRSLSHIRHMIEDLLRLDTDLKTKNINPDEALQLYLLQLAT